MPYKDFYPENERDPLVTQHLKLPQSVSDIFRVMGARESRQLTFLYRQELTEAAERMFKQLKPAEKEALQKIWKRKK